MLVRPGYGGGEPLRATNFLSLQARVSCEWKIGTLGLHDPKKPKKSRLGLRSVFLVADFRARMVVWQK
jgi:hypothetical protein